MSVEGTKILENDFACDIHDDFFERYDGGAEPSALGVELLAEYEAEILSEADREILLSTLAECLWSVGRPVEELRAPLQALLAGDRANCRCVVGEVCRVLRMVS